MSTELNRRAIERSKKTCTDANKVREADQIVRAAMVAEEEKKYGKKSLPPKNTIIPRTK